MAANSKRPPAGDFYQQRMKAWQPIMTPRWVIGTFLIIGIAFVGVGFWLLAESEKVIELKQQYDGEGATGDCMLSADKLQTNCTVTFTPDRDMEPPIYVYYELHNFYQNHRRYVKSRSDKQLMGENLDDDALKSSCDPLLKAREEDDDRTLNPCGLIANSLFDDTFTAKKAEYKLNEAGIAWESDLSDKFKNPAGFATEEGEKTEKYIYESYPHLNLKEKSTDPKSASYNGPGVMNEHFIVWMRTAALSNFRKLYGKIETKVGKGETVEFEVDAHFRVDEFKGKKFLVLSTTSMLGGKNPFLGWAYLVVGIACLVLSVIFIAKQLISPRELGDTQYLVWKNK